MTTHTPTAKLVAIPGGQISYLEAGRGTALMFLHGIGSAAASWRHQIAAFSPHLRVIAWNAPGYGDSTPPVPEAPEAHHYADALRHLMDALAIGQCHLVGHSLGTLMAAAFAARHGQRLLSLTLCGASAGQKHLPAERRAAMLKDRLDDVDRLGPRGMAEKRGPRLLGPNATAAMIRDVVEIQAAAVRPEGYRRAARMLSSGDIFSDVAKFPARLPVQMIFGMDDAITSPEQCREIAAACRGAIAHLVADAGHALYLEQPDQVNATIGRFIGVSPA